MKWSIFEILRLFEREKKRNKREEIELSIIKYKTPKYKVYNIFDQDRSSFVTKRMS